MGANESTKSEDRDTDQMVQSLVTGLSPTKRRMTPPTRLVGLKTYGAEECREEIALPAPRSF